MDSVRKQKNIFKPRNKFQTEFNSVWKKSCNILERDNSESNWNRFGKIYNISEKMTHLLTYDSAYLIIRSTAHHLYQHQNHQHQHFSESSASIGIRWQTNCYNTIDVWAPFGAKKGLTVKEKTTESEIVFTSNLEQKGKL